MSEPVRESMIDQLRDDNARLSTENTALKSALDECREALSKVIHSRAPQPPRPVLRCEDGRWFHPSVEHKVQYKYGNFATPENADV